MGIKEKNIYRSIRVFSLLFLFLIGGEITTYAQMEPVKKKKEKTSKLNNKKKQKTPVIKRYKCPDKPTKKVEKPGKIKEPEEGDEIVYNASIKRGKKKVYFDIVFIKQAQLDIPAFKQFKNNMTDFTAHGEAQFKEIIQKIRDYLGDNTNGKGITLKIIGSASQIPTSFDPSKPNNNINADGSSIYGQTSIENNRKLAQARALELAKKIQEVFIEIGIHTPTLEEIELGPTPWDADAQRRLNDAVIRKSEEEKQAVFAPFQKEQYVKVESQGEYEKKIKPKRLEMHIMSMKPNATFLENGIDREITRYIISKTLYDRLKVSVKQFMTVEERDAYLAQEGFKSFQNPKTKLWYMYQSEEELKAMQLEEEYDRIYQLYELGVVNEKDNQVLKKVITEKYLEGKKHLVVEY